MSIVVLKHVEECSRFNKEIVHQVGKRLHITKMTGQQYIKNKNKKSACSNIIICLQLIVVHFMMSQPLIWKLHDSWHR